MMAQPGAALHIGPIMGRAGEIDKLTKTIPAATTIAGAPVCASIRVNRNLFMVFSFAHKGGSRR